MIQQFFKIGGVKSEKEFLAKYPTEESFFRQHPEAMDLLMNTMPFIPSYTDALTPRADYGGAMSYPNMQSENVPIAPPVLNDYPDYESWANASNQYYAMLQEQANQGPISKEYGGLINQKYDPGGTVGDCPPNHIRIFGTCVEIPGAKGFSNFKKTKTYADIKADLSKYQKKVLEEKKNLAIQKQKQQEAELQQQINQGLELAKRNSRASIDETFYNKSLPVELYPRTQESEPVSFNPNEQPQLRAAATNEPINSEEARQRRYQQNMEYARANNLYFNYDTGDVQEETTLKDRFGSWGRVSAPALAQTMGSFTPQRYEDYTAPGGAGSIGATTQTIATGAPVLAAGVAAAAPSVAAGLSAPILGTPGLTAGNSLGLLFGLRGASRLGKDVGSGYYGDPNISTLGKINRGIETALDVGLSPGVGTAALSGMRGLSSAAQQGSRAFNSAVNYATPALAELSTKLANNPGIVNSIAEAATGFARSPQEGLASLATIIPSSIRTQGQGSSKLGEAFQKLQKGEISSWTGDEWMMGNPSGTINYKSPGTGRVHTIDYNNAGYPHFSGNAPTSDAYVRTIQIRDRHPGESGMKALKFLIKKAPGEQLPRVEDFGFFNEVPASSADQLSLFMSRIGAGPVHLPETGSTSIFSQPIMNSSIQRMISNAKREHGTMENVISLEPIPDTKYLNDIGANRSMFSKKLGRDLTRAELAAQQWEKLRKSYQGLENESGVKFPVIPGIKIRAEAGMPEYFGDEADQFVKELINKNMSNYDFLRDVDPSFIVPDYGIKKFKKKGGEYTGTWNGNQGFDYGGSYIPDYASNAYGLPQFGYGAPVYADGGMSPEQAMMMQQQGVSPEQMSQQQMPEQQGGQQQLIEQVAQALQQGMPPEQVMQQLVKMGMPEDQAQQLIQMIMQQMGGGQQAAPSQEDMSQGQPMMKGGGSFNVGEEMEVTPEQLEELRKKGIHFEIL